MSQKSTPAITEQEKFYNERWDNFEYANSAKVERAVAILERVHGTRKHQPTIIDLGCGMGWLSAILGTIGPTTGVDLSSDAIRKASQRFPHVSFAQVDILNWDYPKELFDIVVSHEVIEHVDQQELYVEIANGLLKRDGYLILTTPNARTWKTMPHNGDTFKQQPLENWLTVSELHALLKVHFEIVSTHTILLGYGTGILRRFVNSIRLRNILSSLKLWPVFKAIYQATGFGLHTVVVAKKRL